MASGYLALVEYSTMAHKMGAQSGKVLSELRYKSIQSGNGRWNQKGKQHMQRPRHERTERNQRVRKKSESGKHDRVVFITPSPMSSIVFS